MLFRFDEIPSTQDTLREYYRNQSAAFGDAVTAESQTRGRGRYGRNFHSPRGSGLYLSILLPYRETDRLTVRAAAAVITAIEEVTGIAPDVKWVNDLYLGGRKIAGILAEALVDETGNPGAVILGVGINLTEPPGGYPEEIRGTAGALLSPALRSALSGQAFALLKKSLTAALLDKLKELGSLGGEEAQIALYRSRLINPSEVPPGALDGELPPAAPASAGPDR